MSLLRTFRVLRMFARMVGRVPMGHLWYLFRRMANEKPHRFAGQTRINSFFPPHPSLAFDRFCDAIAARRRVPLSTYVAVTGECPFHCEHCSYARRAPAQDLDRAEMLDLVQQIKGLGTCTVGFTGGEPLLRGDLEEFIAAAAPEMATIVFTSGGGLDAARARRLAEAGVTCVTVGIEAPAAAAHDAVRGASGSFDQARRAVEACNAEGVYAALATVGFREKIAGGQLDRMFELAAEWGAREFRILAPVATGGLTGCAAAMLSADEVRTLREFHIRHNRRSTGPAVASFAYLESEEMFGCGAGYHHLFIGAGGDVCPCDLTPLSFGSVRDEPLIDIWKRMERRFDLPRCGCLMADLASDIHGELPLDRARSEALCPPRDPGAPLPEGYRRLFRSRES